MKMVGRIAVLLIVLGLCVPSFGEILVYKLTQNGTYYYEGAGGWQTEKGPWRGYMVMDVDFDSNSIGDAAIIEYWRDGSDKYYRQNSLNLELVPVDDGTRRRWIVVEKSIEIDGEVVRGGFHILTGLTRLRSVGADEKQRAANTLKGYGMEDMDNDGRSIGLSTLTATFSTTFTYWANGEDKGNQDFDAAVGHVLDYLDGKGYVEEPAMMG